MKNLDTGKDKIQQICNLLKHETLEPAKEEAENIIDNAKKEANEIISQANRKAEDMINLAKTSMNKEREVFQLSLKEASKQALETLKQKIEKDLFNDSLFTLVSSEMVDPKIIEKLITSMVEAINKEGLSADFSAIIPKQVSKESINALLQEEILSKLKERSVVLGDISAGVELQLHDKQMKIVLSHKDVLALIEKHLRKEFREWLFKW